MSACAISGTEVVAALPTAGTGPAALAEVPVRWAKLAATGGMAAARHMEMRARMGPVAAEVSISLRAEAGTVVEAVAGTTRPSMRTTVDPTVVEGPRAASIPRRAVRSGPSFSANRDSAVVAVGVPASVAPSLWQGATSI